MPKVTSDRVGTQARRPEPAKVYFETRRLPSAECNPDEGPPKPSSGVGVRVKREYVRMSDLYTSHLVILS